MAQHVREFQFRHFVVLFISPSRVFARLELELPLSATVIMPCSILPVASIRFGIYPPNDSPIG